jgi:hypothetical protein
MTTPRLPKNGLKSVFIAVLVIPWLQAIFAFGAATPSAVAPSLLFDHAPVLSDFDADNKVDQATLFSDGHLKRIHIAFGKSSWSSLSFNSTIPERGGLFSGDVDDDGHIDLVWTAENGRESITWLGDGRGNFSIDRSRKIDLNSLLRDAQPRIADRANGQEAQAVLPATLLIVAGGFEYHPYLSVQASVPAANTPSASGPFLAVNRQRGPPSKSF